jgi:hypothetical protein
MPARESFREAKFRVQNRLINELDPKLDLSNQVEVRRQIEELFGKVADEEGLALTRAERVRCSSRSPTRSSASARWSRSFATRPSQKSWSTAAAGLHRA